MSFCGWPLTPIPIANGCLVRTPPIARGSILLVETNTRLVRARSVHSLKICQKIRSPLWSQPSLVVFRYSGSLSALGTVLSALGTLLSAPWTVLGAPGTLVSALGMLVSALWTVLSSLGTAFSAVSTCLSRHQSNVWSRQLAYCSYSINIVSMLVSIAFLVQHQCLCPLAPVSCCLWTTSFLSVHWQVYFSASVQFSCLGSNLFSCAFVQTQYSFCFELGESLCPSSEC